MIDLNHQNTFCIIVFKLSLLPAFIPTYKFLNNELINSKEIGFSKSI